MLSSLRVLSSLFLLVHPSVGPTVSTSSVPDAAPTLLDFAIAEVGKDEVDSHFTILNLQKINSEVKFDDERDESAEPVRGMLEQLRSPTASVDFRSRLAKVSGDHSVLVLIRSSDTSGGNIDLATSGVEALIASGNENEYTKKIVSYLPIETLKTVIQKSELAGTDPE